MADYIVQKGDTLTKIANATGLSVTEIAEKNGIKEKQQKCWVKLLYLLL